jgi:hypothetical protein
MSVSLGELLNIGGRPNDSGNAELYGTTKYARSLVIVGSIARPDRDSGSCPGTWCSFGGVGAALAGVGRAGQAATAGSPTMGSSLNGAMVSRVM